MDKVHGDWRRAQRSEHSAPSTPASPPRTARNNASSLRYAAYDQPTTSLLKSSRTHTKPAPTARTRHRSDMSKTAGDLALFDADEDEDYGTDSAIGRLNSKVSHIAPVFTAVADARDSPNPLLSLFPITRTVGMIRSQRMKPEPRL